MKIVHIAVWFSTCLVGLSADKVFFEAKLLPLGEGPQIGGGDVAIVVHQDRIEYEIKFDTGQRPEMITIEIGELLTFTSSAFTDYYNNNSGLTFVGFTNGSPVFSSRPSVQDYRKFSGSLEYENLFELFEGKNEIPIFVSDHSSMSNSGSLYLTEDNIAQWLANNGFPPDTNLSSPHNEGSVPLLVAYALGLNPSLDLAPQMPSPVVDDGFLYIRYPAKRKSIHYQTVMSTDLIIWNEAEVVNFIESNGNRVSAVSSTGEGEIFMRLLISVDESP